MSLIKKLTILILYTVSIIGLAVWVKPKGQEAIPTEVIVLGKMEKQRYKSSSELLLIVQRVKDGKKFHVNVTPTTYFQAYENKILIFHLTPQDMGDENKAQSLQWVFYILIFFISAISWMALIIAMFL